MKGTLALVGSGEYLPPMEPVDRLLLSRLPGKLRVVCLPTAAGTEGSETIAYWSNLGMEHFQALGADAEAVRVIDRASAEDEALAARIRAANFVYLSGGNPVYLHDTLVETPAWDAIAGVLEAGGVVAGCSAGAMIFGQRSTPLPWHRGFGLLPGAAILPHFDEMAGGLAQMVRLVLPPRMTLLGVEGDTALICGADGYTVAGTGSVMVWSRRQKRRYQAGESVTWP
jgi:cyanophycinase